MTKKAVFLFLLAVLCASTALAAQEKQLVYALNGKAAGGTFYANIVYDSSYGYVQLNFEPKPLDDGTLGYNVTITWIDGSFHQIYGLVPASAIKPMTGLWGPIQVNITYDAFIDPDGIDYEAFSSLVGTLSLYKGLGSGYSTQTGNYTEVYTREDGSTDTRTFKGLKTQQSATFAGTFGATSGSYTLSAEWPYPFAIASMFIQVGTMREIETPPTEE